MTEPIRSGGVSIPQLSLSAVIAVWAAAAIPMGLLAWIGAPVLADQMSGDHSAARALIISLAAGLVWQFVLVLFLVHREQRTLRWPVVKQALWLRAPQSPVTGRKGGRLWWLVLPLSLAFAASAFMPALPPIAGHDLGAFLGTESGQEMMHGAWGWFAIAAVSAVCNTVIGEELLFRGYLLPRMEGVFGRRDWVANGVLHAVYHLHMPWHIPTALLDMFTVAYPSRRYRSALMGIAVHSSQTVFFLAIMLALVMGG